MVILKKIRAIFGIIKEFVFNYYHINLIRKKSLEKNKIIFLPSIEYYYPLFQRPQYLANELSSKKNIFLLYLEASSVYSKYKKIEEIKKNLYLCRYFRTVPYFLKNSWFYLISGQAINTIHDLKKYKKMGHRIIYDYVDEISVDICGNNKTYQFLKERHNFIKTSKIADLILCTSEEFVNEFIRFYSKDKVIYLPNAVDLRIFNSNKNYPLPSDLIEIVKQKKLIIGYHGAMAKWLDYKLINKIAKNHPEINFVFLGLDYDRSLKELNQNLKNIFYLGVVNFKDLPKYLFYFNYSWIPFRKGKVAQNTSPLKLFESLAMGKLVLVTKDLKECYGFKGVYVFDNTLKEFDKALKKILDLKNKKKIISCIYKNIFNYSWRKRTEIIYKKLNEI
ncbi:MAG: hypothetical protein N2114_02530 [Candidatus Goldbacteria bacterium]|nr:hypothetical protein [Candidatus Goldiibacteriota bacterium]